MIKCFICSKKGKLDNYRYIIGINKVLHYYALCIDHESVKFTYDDIFNEDGTIKAEWIPK